MVTALAGSILGFLPYNFNPAKTFIGDTGSNFLGYSLSIISILGMAKTYTAIVIIAPLLIFALPLLDTGLAIIRRIIKTKSGKQIAMLKGLNIRIQADSDIEDLDKIDEKRIAKSEADLNARLISRLGKKRKNK